MPWTRNSASWGTAKTHLPLNEGVGESLKLSAEELKSIHATRFARTKMMTAAVSKAHYIHQREADLEASKARKRAEKAAYKILHAEIVAEWYETAIQPVLRQKKHWCEPCQHAFQGAGHLETHLTTPKHLKAIDAQVSQSSAVLLLQKKRTDMDITSKQFYHTPCKHPARSNYELGVHMKSKKHARQVAKLASGSQPTV